MMSERGFYVFAEILERLQATPPAEEDARLAELWEQIWPTAATMTAMCLADDADPSAGPAFVPPGEWADVRTLLKQIEDTPAQTPAGTMVRAAAYALATTGVVGVVA